VKVELFGAWAKTSHILASVDTRFQKAVRVAMLQEANAVRGHIVRNISTGGVHAGKPFAPLSPNTLIIRSFKGFGGSKPLMVTGALRSSVSVVEMAGGAVFVGVKRRSGAGKGGVNLAELHEFGGGPWTRPMTPKQRRFLAAAFAKAGKSFGGKGSGTPGMITTKIPARPFVRPVVERFGKPQDVAKRFWATVAQQMGGDLGKP
jgi:hypothetical protein